MFMKKIFFVFSLTFFLFLSGCKSNQNVYKENSSIIISWFASWSALSSDNISDLNIENHKEIVVNPLHKFIVYKIWKTYPIAWNGDLMFNDTFSKNQIYTNDPNWKIESIPVSQAAKDIDTYKCFYCEEWWDKSQYFWEDNTNLFLSYDWIAAPKKDVMWFVPLQHIGEQAVIWLIGYSNGYLILFPFKFPVDQETFKTVQIKEQLQRWEKKEIPSLKSVSDDLRRPKFQNGGLQYDKYLADDKDWIYLWGMSASDSIDRIKKESDFKILKQDEVHRVISYDEWAWLEVFTWKVKPNWRELQEWFAQAPWIYYYDNAIYISDYVYGAQRFPIDWATMKWEEKQIQEAGEEYPRDYHTLSDKNWWYQLIYHVEWDYYELQRIKK